MLEKSAAIAHQLALTAPEEVTFTEGGTTVMTPAPLTPVLDEPRLELDGVWEVLRWPFPAAEETLLGQGGGDVVWGEIEQPGPVHFYHPDQSPHTIPDWNRVTQAHIDPADGAIVRCAVEIPAAWAGRRIFLRLEGIYPAGVIYWDGQPVAEQWSGLTPIEIDLTGRATPCTLHTLAVRLYRRHAALQLDMPRHALDFTGLSRSAFLHAVEPAYVSDWRLAPALEDGYRSGMLRGDLSLCNTSDCDLPVALHLLVLDAEGRQVTEATTVVDVPPASTEMGTLSEAVGMVDTWNAECPTLYTCILRITAPGQAVQTLRQRIGFRRFELTDGRPTLNGTPVKFRGVNHLTHHPEGGLYTPEPWLRDCLTLMKRANVNTIRTHFYGPPELTALCDELGLYLVQELPIDWGTDYVQETSLLGPMLHRMEAGVRRDRNHPSVMVWAIGNENMPANEEAYDAFLTHLRLCGSLVKTLDPTRPTMFPPPGPANAIKGIFEARLGDIADTHYSFTLAQEFMADPSPEATLVNPRTWTPTFETHTRQELLARGWSGTWFSSEYGINNMQPDLLNAPYTSIIADVLEDPLSGKNSQQVFIDRLSREWGVMRDDPACLGGAYFAWIAAGAGDPWGWTRWGEDADWGIVTADLHPKPAFWAMRVLYAPLRFPARITWHPGDTTLTLPLYNGYNRWDLAECTLRSQMNGGLKWGHMLREWRDLPMAGAPGEIALLTLPIWHEGTLKTLEGGSPALCRFTVLDPTGFRTLMADVLVLPEAIAGEIERAMPIGPDALL
jgi:hypothetical protein